MDRQIFVAVQGQRHGPYPESQVRQMLTDGNISESDLAWTNGMAGWAPLSSLLNLMPSAATPPAIPDIPEYHPRPLPSGYAVQQYTGVGGWLLVFCILSTIVAPLYAFANMYFNWQNSAEAFAEFPAIRTGVIIENIAIGAVAIVGIGIGIALWVRAQNIRRIVRGYLIGRLVFFILVEVVVVAYIGTRSPQIVPFLAGAAVGACIREGVYFGIWFSYFTRSVRVQNTYGHKRRADMHTNPERRVSTTAQIDTFRGFLVTYYQHIIFGAG